MPQYQIPSDRSPPTGYWPSAGSGEVADGPIVALTLDSGADNYVAIQSAINAAAAASNNTVVQLPAGTYPYSTTLSCPTTGGAFPLGNWKIRGTVDSQGQWLTHLNFTSSASQSKGMSIGIGQEFDTPQTITAGLTKGSTTITVADTSSFSLYRVCRITLTLDPNEVWDVYYYPGKTSVHFFNALIVGKTSTTITLNEPVPSDYTTTQKTGATIACGTKGAMFNVVVSDLDINGTTAADMWNAFEVAGGAYACLFKNIKVSGHQRFAFPIYDSIRSRITECWIGLNTSLTPSHGGLLMGTNTLLLVDHNVVEQNFPHIEILQGNVGNVVAYNYITKDESGFGITTNHGPQNDKNLYEGNICPLIISDGLFGGEQNRFTYRNWLTGKFIVSGSPADLPGYADKRFVRRGSAVGNVLQSPSFAGWWSTPYSLGDPNLGNSSFTGTANSLTGSWWIDTTNGTGHTWTGTVATRTSEISGTINLATGTGPSLQAHVTHTDGGIGGIGYNGNPAVITNVTGDVATITSISNGSIPAIGDSITLTVSKDGYQEQDQATFAIADGGSFEKLGNYNFINHGVPSDEALGSITLPSSFYLSSEDTRWSSSGLSWPPFGPDVSIPNSDTQNQIPAAYRYIYSEWPSAAQVSAPTFSPSSGTYSGAQTIGITSSTSGATIRYTTNGTTPTSSIGTIYSGLFSVSVTTTVKAIAYNGILTDSNVSSSTYTIEAISPGNISVNNSLITNIVLLS